MTTDPALVDQLANVIADAASTHVGPRKMRPLWQAAHVLDWLTKQGRLRQPRQRRETVVETEFSRVVGMNDQLRAENERLRTEVERLRLAASLDCTCGYGCPSTIHAHGCRSDDGDCLEPGAHS